MICPYCMNNEADQLIVAVSEEGPKRSLAVCRWCKWVDETNEAIEEALFAALKDRGLTPKTVEVETL